MTLLSRPHLRAATFAALGVIIASAPAAQTVLSGDHSIVGNLCVGADCTGSEMFPPGVTTKFRADTLRTYFEDTSTTVGFPSNDWEMVFNDSNSGGQNYFALRDVDANGQVFRISSGAPTNAFVMTELGTIGLGTAFPQAEIHIESADQPEIYLSQNTSGGNPEQRFSFAVGDSGFAISDKKNSTDPVFITGGTPTFTLLMSSAKTTFNATRTAYDFEVNSLDQYGAFYVEGDNGRVGLGTTTPEQQLHIRSNTANTDAFALFDANAAGSDAAFLLRQNGTVPTTWEFRNQQGSGRLNVGIAGGNTPFKIDDAANNNLLRLGLNGQNDVVSVTGRLLVNNTQMNVPDYVFSDDYALRPLSEVQAFIDTNSHLPDVPSEAEIKANGVDMTAMQMTLLKKVEELTLYTLEQEATIAAQAVTNATLLARLEALEQHIAAN